MTCAWRAFRTCLQPQTVCLQVIYPLTVAEAAGKEEGGNTEEGKQALERHLDQLMEAVRLSYLVKREGGWDSITEWGETLSLGEILHDQPANGLLYHCCHTSKPPVLCCGTCCDARVA